ncbi:MAG: helix-turn-helix domain-containing protein [Nitrospirota bacterium]|nr:helix-turn-helix domain-containing protein [Nitrospirota bacterium]
MYTLPQVMRVVHCSRSTISRLLRAKRLTSVKIGKTRLVPHHAIIKLLEGKR